MNLWLPNPPKHTKWYEAITCSCITIKSVEVQEFFLLQMSDVILHFIVFTLLKTDIEYRVKSNVGCVVITDM